MEYRYLYIDDWDKKDIAGTISGIEAGGGIKIEHSKPAGDWEREYDRIAQLSFQGVILDLRLQEKAGLDGNYAKYSGAIIAHAIREMAKEKTINEFPLVLFSGNYNLQQFFDKTGEDAFDLRILKEELNNNSAFETLRLKLLALARGYDWINHLNRENPSRAVEQLMGFGYEALEERFRQRMETYINKPTHDIAAFIVRNLLEKEGLLISEQLLAARLGIEINASNDWPKLKLILNDFSYKGVFMEGWSRWWMYNIEHWWDEAIGEGLRLQPTSASKRVDLLKGKLGLDGLVPANKIEKARSDQFWIICQGLKRPLDPIDGLFVSGQENAFPWQSKQYVSHEAAINRISIEDWKDVAASEKDKLDQLKTFYSRERIRR